MAGGIRLSLKMIPQDSRPEDAFQVNAEQAAELLAQLVALGLIEPVSPKPYCQSRVLNSHPVAKPLPTPPQQNQFSKDSGNTSAAVPGAKAPFFSAACSLKPSGWEMWTSPSNCCRRSPSRRNFGNGVTGADMRPESRQRASDPVLTGFSGPGRRFLKRFGRGRVLSACTEFMTLPRWWMCVYRVLRGDPERVAALIPAGQSS